MKHWDEAEARKAADDAGAQCGAPIAYESFFRFSPGLAAARYRLANGLRILLMPDGRAPVFAYQTWFKVGSRDEEPQRTGLAHLFEHLMFKGTVNHSVGEFDREMERRGSETNAATWVDWTYYHEALPARGDNLDTVIAYESDRMNGLVLDEKTFRSEVEVVKNERRMSVDDSVGGALSEALYELAFSEHPYRWSTIGSMAHLDAATVDDLRAFYRKNYAPDNALVVIVGDVDPTQTLCKLANAYGPLPASGAAYRAPAAEPPQKAPRLQQIEKSVMAPQMVFGYRAPAQRDDAFTALEVLSEVLAAGDSARLYRRLVVEDQLATDVGGSVAPFADPGLYQIHVTARDGVDPLRIIEAVQDEVEKLTEPLQPFELDKARNGLELSFLDSLKDAEGCAELLGHYEINYDDYSMGFHCIEQWQQTTADELSAVAQKVFAESQRNVVIAMKGVDE